MPTTVIVFGNPNLNFDARPVQLLPALRNAFPDIDFRHLDPNEEWRVPPELTVIDTVINLKEPRLFESLAAFQAGPRLTMHDFDAFSNLQLMLKIGKLKSVRVIGLPPLCEEQLAIDFCRQALDQPTT
jgi:hypothetical protein